MDSLLVTGAAGFIGSNFCKQLVLKNKYKIYILDDLTYAGSLENLNDIDPKKYEFIKGSICNQDFVENLFKEYKFKKIVHFAAETHVDNSISSPSSFIQTNINGTYTLLQAALDLWMEKPFQKKSEFQHSLFLHISTDEVYGSLDIDAEPFSENSPYLPNSPYSASKASSDLIVRSFNKTYGLNTIITNCSNNYGEKQHIEKLIPKVIKCCFDRTSIPVYGDGSNVRDWIYVGDHCEALSLILESKYFGESFCIGGDNEISNKELVNLICLEFNNIFPEYNHLALIEFVEDRLGHDKRYAINSEKFTNSFGKFPKTNFTQRLRETIEWYLKLYRS